MEKLVLGLFCGALLGCIGLHQSILYALTGGLVLFWGYAVYRGFRWRELIRMTLSGVRTVRNILVTFVLIGMLTALWRQAGTIPVIVCYATRLIRPSVFLLMTFLLNCLVSVLTGTAFGTAATMGVICGAIGASMQVPVVLVGGAVLSGVFFGDRCSPVSTSALLVSELTGTSIFENIRRMLRSAAPAFVLSCVVYGAAGWLVQGQGQAPDLERVFGQAFRLHWLALTPALVILVLALLQVNVKKAMGASILTALPICVGLQKVELSALPMLLVQGYHSDCAEAAALLDGGGILSMLKVGAIVCLSSSYSGIFRQTGLLDRTKEEIAGLAAHTGRYCAMLVTSAVSGMIACNQTLAIMLTHQLCGDLDGSREELALDLEDTAVVTAPLVPWSIACGVPLTAVEAPASAIWFAVFLWLLPAWRLGTELAARRRRGGTGSGQKPEPVPENQPLPK